MNELYLNISENEATDDYSFFVADVNILSDDYVDINNVSLIKCPNLKTAMKELISYLSKINFNDKKVYYKSKLISKSSDIYVIDSEN